MKSRLDKKIKKYVKTTKRLLTCCKENRSHFLMDMEGDIEKFIQENDSIAYSDVINNFGSPDELAQTYLENIPQKEIVAYKKRKNFYIRTVVAVFGILFIGTISGLYFKLQEAREMDVIYIEESIIIEEESKDN